MTKRREPKMIMHLRWEETSGVDAPANEEPGWAVMKAEERQQMAKLTPLQREFEDFLSGLKAAMSGTQYKALIRVLRVLVCGDTDLSDPAGAGMKARFAPTVEALEKLVEDMKSLDLSDDVCVTVLRFLGGNPLHPTFGDSEPGAVNEETQKAMRESGLEVAVVKVLHAAHKRHGAPLVPGLDAKLAEGLDEEAERRVVAKGSDEEAD